MFFGIKQVFRHLTHPGGKVVTASNYESQVCGFESCWRQNTAHVCVALHCTKPSNVSPLSSQYYLNSVERDIKYQILLIII